VDVGRGLLLPGLPDLLVQAPHLLDHLAHPLDVPILVEFAVVLVGVPDHLFDPNLPLAKFVAQVEDFGDGHGGI
jgi:hypothetical protein